MNNILCHSPTGLILGGYMSGFDESVTHIISNLLKRYIDVDAFLQIDMNNGIINGDRGY